jgi:DNA-binding NarL/FixJ family response regulator
LVEDNHRFRKNVARVLQQVEGLDCSHHFSNAEDALDALMGDSQPDVILLDVELPGQNGIQAVRKIKSICPDARVVMLTAFDDHEKVFKAICAGASGYLLKASPVERIVESIHEALTGGAPLSPRVAKSVLEMFSKLHKPRPDSGLTGREEEVLELMMQGLPKKGIADKLSVSYHTVDAHVKNIYTKLHVHSFTEAVAWAINERKF